MSRLEVSLPVDETTAKRFARVCQLETMWQRKIIPAVIVAVALILVIGIIGLVSNDSRLLLAAILVAGGLSAITVIARSSLTLMRSRHHPKLIGRGTVLVCDVDRETAQMWISLNPTGAIEIVG